MVCVSLTVIMARSADLVGLFPPATAFLLLSMELGQAIANATCLCALFMRRTRAWMLQHVHLVIALLLALPVLALPACVCACVCVGNFVCLSASRCMHPEARGKETTLCADGGDVACGIGVSTLTSDSCEHKQTQPICSVMEAAVDELARSFPGATGYSDHVRVSFVPRSTLANTDATQQVREGWGGLGWRSAFAVGYVRSCLDADPVKSYETWPLPGGGSGCDPVSNSPWHFAACAYIPMIASVAFMTHWGLAIGIAVLHLLVLMASLLFMDVWGWWVMGTVVVNALVAISATRLYLCARHAAEQHVTLVYQRTHKHTTHTHSTRARARTHTHTHTHTHTRTHNTHTHTHTHTHRSRPSSLSHQSTKHSCTHSFRPTCAPTWT